MARFNETPSELSRFDLRAHAGYREAEQRYTDMQLKLGAACKRRDEILVGINGVAAHRRTDALDAAAKSLIDGTTIEVSDALAEESRLRRDYEAMGRQIAVLTRAVELAKDGKYKAQAEASAAIIADLREEHRALVLTALRAALADVAAQQALRDLYDHLVENDVLWIGRLGPVNWRRTTGLDSSGHLALWLRELLDFGIAAHEIEASAPETIRPQVAKLVKDWGVMKGRSHA